MNSFNVAIYANNKVFYYYLLFIIVVAIREAARLTPSACWSGTDRRHHRGPNCDTNRKPSGRATTPQS